ncbi:RES family NAD+ phosphorylase [Streptomyces albidoflavus]
MPRYQPPPAPAAPLSGLVLPAGTLLHRVHSTEFAPDAFNPLPAHCLYGGGRFDSTGCEKYGFLYAGLGPLGALGETLLRSLAFDPAGGPRLLPRTALRDRAVSRLRTTADLSLVPLTSAKELGAVHQDTWLVHAEAPDYPYTRDWAHWIRRHSGPWAQGLLWPSKRDPAEECVVLFHDRCPEGLLAMEGDSLRLDTAEGGAWLDAWLEGLHVRSAPR